MPASTPGPGSTITAQAIGSVPAARRPRCMFCSSLLDDEGGAFLDHVRVSPDGADACESWLGRLDEDRPGGG